MVNHCNLNAAACPEDFENGMLTTAESTLNGLYLFSSTPEVFYILMNFGYSTRAFRLLFYSCKNTLAVSKLNSRPLQKSMYLQLKVKYCIQ